MRQWPRANVGDFQRTYKKYVSVHPHMSGEISLKFTISPAGDIIAISIAGSNTGSSEMDDEIKDKARRMKFDPIEKGNVTQTYKFIFNED